MNQTRKDVLNGWKEIAAYLGRDPRTVERWEKQRSLPVRRLPGSGRATVYALVSELDHWLASTPVRDPLGGPLAEGAGGSTSSVSDAPGERSSVSEQQPGPGTVSGSARPRRRWRWLRWATPLVVILLICWAGYKASGRKGHSAGRQPATVASEPARSRKMVPSSPVFGVEELFLRGSYQMEVRTPEALHRAQDAFTAAIEKDGRYAPAYAGLANTFLLLREYSVLPDTEAYPKAMDAAERALALDPDLPQAHAAMGFVDFFWRWDGAAAENQFKQALALDPNLPLAHHWYGSVLMHEGRFREGAAELAVAQKLDPSSAAILTMRALALGLSGRRAEGADMLQEAIGVDKAGQHRDPATMHSVLGTLSLMPPKNLPRYLAESELAAELRGDTASAANLRRAAAVFHAHGEQAMWRALLAEELRHSSGSATYALARYETQLGAKEQALNHLADLLARHDPALIGISVDPLLLDLHREPRFQQMRAAMGLPEVEED